VPCATILDSICLLQKRFREGIVRLRPLEHKELAYRSGYEGCPVHKGTPLHDNMLLEKKRHNETEQTHEEPNYQNVIDGKHVMEE